MEEEIPEEIRKLAVERQEARQSGHFDHADFLRDEIEYRGYTIHEKGGAFTLIPIPEEKLVVNVPNKHEKDFKYYLKQCSVVPNVHAYKDWDDKEEGYDAVQCWYWLETRGGHLPCNNIEQWATADAGKKCINMTIMMWVEATLEGVEFILDVKKYCEEDQHPKWVYDSYKNQLNAIRYGDQRPSSREV